MNKLSTRSLIAAVMILPACFEDEVTELGVYGGAQSEPPGLTVGDSSVAIPIPDASTPAASACPGLADASVAIARDDAPPLPDLQCYRFVAHAAGGTSPYPVAAGATQNVRFTFRAPWQGTTYIRSIEPIIDDQVALHHWLLYAETSALPEGVQVVDEVTQEGPLVYGWLPGSGTLQLPHDFGIPVQGDVSYTLAVRYANTSGGDTVDGSGLQVCVSAQPVFFGVSLSLREGL